MTNAEQQLSDFLTALTDLSVKHKIGLTGDITAFVMEHDDMPHSYIADADSKVSRR